MDRCGRRLGVGALGAACALFCIATLLEDTHYYYQERPPPPKHAMPMPAMRTIVAYSQEKRAEMGRIVGCEGMMKKQEVKGAEGSWQRVTGGGVELYSGYYDDRNGRYVRMLAMSDGVPYDELPPLYCQTQHRQRLESVEAVVTPIWWQEWDPTSRDAPTPLLISCPLSEDTAHGESYTVSVTTGPCEAITSNSLTIEIPKAASSPNVRLNFTVCVKDMHFDEDISERLVEWFEALLIMGAEKVDVYVARVPIGVTNVLNYYRDVVKIARVKQAPRMGSSGEASLWQRRRDHLLAYNDCLYSNLYASRYVIPLDIDEVIVPRNGTWHDLLPHLETMEKTPPGAASLAVSNAFFFDAFADRTEHFKNRRRRKRSLHMLRHTRRSSLISPAPQYSKSFVATKTALTVFNHYALGALGGAERARAVPADLALLHHYKSTCRPLLVDCHRYVAESVEDDTLTRHADELTRNVDRVLELF